MSNKRTKIAYAFSLLMSTSKKTLTEAGRISGVSRDTVRRSLNSKEQNISLMKAIAKVLFEKEQRLVLSIDDTLIRRIHSLMMEGTCKFYNTKSDRLVTAHKVIVAGLTNGKYFAPVQCDFLFARKECPDAIERKDLIIKTIIQYALGNFPKKEITVAADGAFANKRFLEWAIEKNIRVELRMHSNRKVTYKNEQIKISEIEDLMPKGRHKSRTIKVIWYSMTLYITAEKRIDKHNEESIVYLASTYHAKPSKHVTNYKKRWATEKLFRI